MAHIKIWQISGIKYEIEVGETTFRLEKYGIGRRAQFILERLVPGQMPEGLGAFKTKDLAFAFCREEVPMVLRFDRHKIFSTEDVSTVMEFLHTLEDREVSNKVYGLFDGYLYRSIIPMLQSSLTMRDLVHRIQTES
jgi:hypothetical protein